MFSFNLSKHRNMQKISLCTVLPRPAYFHPHPPCPSGKCSASHIPSKIITILGKIGHKFTILSNFVMTDENILLNSPFLYMGAFLTLKKQFLHQSKNSSKYVFFKTALVPSSKSRIRALLSVQV